MIAPLPEDGEGEPEGHEGEPGQEDAPEEAGAGEAVCLLVDPEALDGGGDDHQEEGQLEPSQESEGPPGPGWCPPQQPVRPKEGGKDQRRGQDELREPLPGILGVGEPRGELHHPAPAEEVAQLHQHEGPEQQIHQDQDRPRLGDSQGGAGEPRRQRLPEAGAGEETHQVSGGQPPQHRREEEVGGQQLRIQRPHGSGDHLCEDGVRGHEEGAEDQEQGNRKDPTHQHPPEPAPPGRSPGGGGACHSPDLPFRIVGVSGGTVHQEAEDPQAGVEHRAGHRLHLVPYATSPDPGPPPPEGEEGEGGSGGQEGHRMEGRGVPEHKGGGQEDPGGHPGPRLPPERQSSPPGHHRHGQGQRHGEEEEIEPRLPLHPEEEVRRQAEGGSGQERRPPSPLQGHRGRGAARQWLSHGTPAAPPRRRPHRSAGPDGGTPPAPPPAPPPRSPARPGE